MRRNQGGWCYVISDTIKDSSRVLSALDALNVLNALNATLLGLTACVIGGCASAPPPPLQPERCGDPPVDPVVTVTVPDRPFQALPSTDGCWVFVSMPREPRGPGGGVAVLRRAAGRLTYDHEVGLGGGATGMALTHDGRTLLAVAGNDVAFIDVERLVQRRSNAVLGTIHDPAAAGRVYVTVSPDDRLALVADENSRAVSVIDLDRARTSGYDAAASTLGRIPMGVSPIAMVYTPDARHVLVTNEVVPLGGAWPGGCAREGAPAGSGETVPQGAIVIVSADSLHTNPGRAVDAIVPAGCSPVRLVLSPRGDRAYVTVRGSNELRVYSVDSLIAHPAHSLLDRLSLGPAPVGVAVVNDGQRLVVTNSNRFGNERGSLTVVDASRLAEGTAAVIGSIPAGVFPRELRVTPDGATLLLTNFGSRNMQALDLTRLPIQRLK